MAWIELTPPTIEDLFYILSEVSDSQAYIFRGQASCEWGQLMPSLHRVFANNPQGNQVDQVLLEAQTIAAFRRHARSYLPPSELAYFDLILDGLTLMQHY